MNYWDKGQSLVTEELVTQAKGYEFKNPTKKPCTATHTCNSSTEEVKKGGSQGFPGRPA